MYVDVYFLDNSGKTSKSSVLLLETRNIQDSVAKNGKLKS